MNKPELTILIGVGKIVIYVDSNEVDPVTLGIDKILTDNIYESYTCKGNEALINQTMIDSAKLLPREIFSKYHVMLQLTSGTLIKINKI